MAVGMAANPHEAHQAGRHRDRLHVQALLRMMDNGRAGKRAAGTPTSSLAQSAFFSRS